MKDIARYTFSKNTPSQIEVVSLAALTSTRKSFLLTPHRTSFYHIFLVRNCRATHRVDFKPVQLQPYSLLFIEKERVHQFDQKLNYDGEIIIFTDNFFVKTSDDFRFLRSSRLFNDLHDNCLMTLGQETFEKFQSVCYEIDRETNDFDEKTSPLILKNLLQNFLLYAEREKKSPDNINDIKDIDFEYVILFKELLEKHYHREKSVSFYSRQLAISERRLGQATHKFSGKLPKELIHERVSLEAKRLLVYGNHTIKEIAYKLGFEEPTNFIKYFKKQTAQTPLEFRDINLNSH